MAAFLCPVNRLAYLGMDSPVAENELQERISSAISAINKNRGRGPLLQVVYCLQVCILILDYF
jgi:hypothetical protein